MVKSLQSYNFTPIEMIYENEQSKEKSSIRELNHSSSDENDD